MPEIALNPPPFNPLWEKGVGGMLTGVDVWASPCAPSPVSAISTPKRPLLPLWEKGVGGMRDKGARKCRKSLLKAPVRRVAESVHRIAKHFFARYAAGCMIKSARDQWRHMVQRSTHSLALRR